VAATSRPSIPLAEAVRIAEGVIRAERAPVESMSITFVGPARIRTLNREHLGHDRSTDVLSFALSGLRSPISGLRLVADIYICPAEAARNARRFGTTAKDETRRLVVHGVLHALGYDHPETGDRTKSAMWRIQERHMARAGKRAR
jgi:probable rRNA maturation factor